MVKSLLGFGLVVFRIFVLPRSLAIASLSKACSLRVGARPSMPTTIFAFGPLKYEFNKLMVPSFSGSGTVIGEMSPRDGEGRGCSLLLGVGSGEEGEVGLPLFLLMGVGVGLPFVPLECWTLFLILFYGDPGSLSFPLCFGELKCLRLI